MKTLTIELEDEAFEMLSASAAATGTTPEALAALPVDDMARNDGHVVWDVEFEPAAAGIREGFTRGDVTDCVETNARGYVVDTIAGKVRLAVHRHVAGAYRVGDHIVGPRHHVVVTSAAPVDGLKVHTWSLYNRPDHGCFASPAQNISGG